MHLKNLAIIGYYAEKISIGLKKYCGNPAKFIGK